MTTANTGTGGTQAAAAAAAIKSYLSIAPTKVWAVIGTVTGGGNGGSSANVVWQQQLPIIPSFASGVDYTITLPVALTLGATTGAATLSKFAPYSAVQEQLTIGGAAPWPQTELTPWYLDQVMHHVNYDPNYPGYGNNEGYFASILDEGPTPNQIGGSGSLNPGTTVTNVTGSPVTTNYLFTFKVRQQWQRKRQLLWGAVPFGDPENRPNNTMQVSPLVGQNPEQNLFTAGVLATAVIGYTAVPNATITARYTLRYVDMLPPGVASAPQPTVGYGVQMVPWSVTAIAAGVLQPITHRTAMLYTAIHHILVNGQVPVEADYFGLWDDQDVQSSKWNYDASQNTFQYYFDEYQRVYRHYPILGVYTADLEGGVFPEVPTVTPYDAVMSPDASYAQTFGIPVTPAMTTTVRLPSGDSASNPYIRVYDFGIVRVPY